MKIVVQGKLGTRPAHIGDVIRTFMTNHYVTKEILGTKLGLTDRQVFRLLKNGDRYLNKSDAEKLGDLFTTRPQLWLGVQDLIYGEDGDELVCPEGYTTCILIDYNFYDGEYVLYRVFRQRYCPPDNKPVENTAITVEVGPDTCLSDILTEFLEKYRAAGNKHYD